MIHHLPRNHGSPEFATDEENVARATPGTALARTNDARTQHDPTPSPTADAVQPATKCSRSPTRTVKAHACARSHHARRARFRWCQTAPGSKLSDPERDGEGVRWRPVKVSDGTKGWIAAGLLTPRDDSLSSSGR